MNLEMKNEHWRWTFSGSLRQSLLCGGVCFKTAQQIHHMYKSGRGQTFPQSSGAKTAFSYPNVCLISGVISSSPQAHTQQHTHGHTHLFLYHAGRWSYTCVPDVFFINENVIKPPPCFVYVCICNNMYCMYYAFVNIYMW